MVTFSTTQLDWAFIREVLAQVTIGNHVWIGSRALILPGVTVGEGAVASGQWAPALMTND